MNESLAVALVAGVFRINMTFDIKSLRDHAEFILLVLADLLHLTATGTDRRCWLMNDGFHIQVVRDNSMSWTFDLGISLFFDARLVYLVLANKAFRFDRFNGG